MLSPRAQLSHPLEHRGWAPHAPFRGGNWTAGVVVMPWAWSLALEEHFYLLVPLLVLLLRTLPSVRAP